MTGDPTPIRYPDPEFCQELRHRLRSWSDEDILSLYHDAEVENRRDPRDVPAQIVRDELLVRGLSL